MSAAASSAVASATGAPVMIFAGGTGGHIFPGLAVAAALRARGVPVVWLGADGGMETRLVPQHGIDIETIAISGLRGKGIATLLRAPLRVLSAIRAAAKVLRRHRPRAVVSFGGFAAGPGGIAAAIAGVPLLVHEQNRAPGMTNRVLSMFARRVLTGFPDSFPGKETVVGNPVRSVISGIATPAERFAEASPRLRVLVLGGSQGARALNDALPKALSQLQGIDHDVRHQCGEKMRDDAVRAYADAGVVASVEPFIADMAAAYAWADIVVCRAGALTLAEICAAGVASVLVPLPTAVDDHQTKNGLYLVERGAAVLLKQDDTLADRLATTLRALAGDAAKRLTMAEAARSLAKPDAADRVADIVIEVAAQHAATHQETRA
jgi:UDP-N-acetylglucosamine--N-acetylmuramyl-(pentapeptide) pyrophosphoryl-undecaprenol N-acetylglucosamine transferase